MRTGFVANIEADDSRVASPALSKRDPVLPELRGADGSFVSASVCAVRAGTGVEPEPILLLRGVLPVSRRCLVVVIVCSLAFFEPA